LESIGYAIVAPTPSSVCCPSEVFPTLPLVDVLGGITHSHRGISTIEKHVHGLAPHLALALIHGNVWIISILIESKRLQRTGILIRNTLFLQLLITQSLLSCGDIWG
jgi:hypothetical protein